MMLYEDTIPVSSATLAIHSNVARLDNVATVKEQQGRGYGKKIIEYCVQKARKSGCEYMVFEGSEQGIKLYRKMGFTETAMSYIYSLNKIVYDNNISNIGINWSYIRSSWVPSLVETLCLLR